MADATTRDLFIEMARNFNLARNAPPIFSVARESGAADFGAASGGEPRDVMTPDPPCP